MSGTAEVCHDGRQRGGHDGLVESRQQHAEQDRGEDEVAALRTDQRTTGPRIGGLLGLFGNRASHIQSLRPRRQVLLRQPATPTAIIRNCLTAMRLISSCAAESCASSMASAITIIEFTNKLARMLRSSVLQSFRPGKRARSVASSEVISRISVRIA